MATLTVNHIQAQRRARNFYSGQKTHNVQVSLFVRQFWREIMQVSDE